MHSGAVGVSSCIVFYYSNLNYSLKLLTFLRKESNHRLLLNQSPQMLSVFVCLFLMEKIIPELGRQLRVGSMSMCTCILIPSIHEKLGLAVCMENPSTRGSRDIGCSNLYIPACTHTCEYIHIAHTYTHIKHYTKIP